MDPQQSDKLLHREQVIRFAGFLLIISPVFNILMTIWASTDPQKWSLHFFMDFAHGQTVVQWLMQAANIVVGSMMLKGRRPNWIPVLVVLFTFIVYGVLRYKASAVSGRFVPTAALMINIGLFLLVYYQEYWQVTHGHLQKLKPLIPKMPKPTPVLEVEALPVVPPPEPPTPEESLSDVPKEKFPGTLLQIVPQELVELKAKLPDVPVPLSRPPAPPPVNESKPQLDLSFLKGLIIDFEGIGPWGYVESTSDTEIRLEVFGAVPDGLESRKVEIPLLDEGVLQFRLTHKSGNKMSFKLEAVRWEAAAAA